MWGDGCSNDLALFKKKKKNRENLSNCKLNFQLDQLAGQTCSATAQLLALGLS